MRELFLVKHARPEIVPGVPAKDWKLSEEGYRQSERLAELLGDAGLGRIITSLEPKAYETGRILAERLGLPFSAAPGLDEHHRETTEFISDTVRWESVIQEFFASPAELVFGEETADEAHSRFSRALQRVMDGSGGNLAVVAHGTVLSLLVSRANGLDGFELWKRLGLPSLVEVEWPSLRLVRVLERV